MTDNEKIILLMKYTFCAEHYLRNDYIEALNNFVIHIGHIRKFHPDETAQDILELYKKQIRYEAFKEFSGNLDKILYGR